MGRQRGRKSSKQLVLEFLLANVGQVVTSDQIKAAAGGASEWARRLRELRDEQVIQSCRIEIGPISGQGNIC